MLPGSTSLLDEHFVAIRSLLDCVNAETTSYVLLMMPTSLLNKPAVKSANMIYGENLRSEVQGRRRTLERREDFFLSKMR